MNKIVIGFGENMEYFMISKMPKDTVIEIRNYNVDGVDDCIIEKDENGKY